MLPGGMIKYVAIITLVLFGWIILSGQFMFADEADILTKAKQSFHEGDLDGAIKEINRIIDTYGSDPAHRPAVAEAYYLLAKIYQVGGDDAGVEENLKAAFRTFPDLKLDEPDLYFKEKAETIHNAVRLEIEAAAQKSREEQKGVIAKEKKRKRRFPVLLVVGGIALVAILFLLLKKDKNGNNVNGDHTGTLRITSEPDGADIYLDDEKQSQTTPAVLYNVSAGPHTVRLDKSGYEIYETTVTVINGQEATVTASLTEFETGIQWIWIPAGAFSMGDDFSVGDADEQPVHTVTLDGYYMSKYEVTFELYDRYCDETGAAKPDDNGWGREQRPVIFVTWDDAHSFCEWLSHRSGETVRLPTEAQWEKAAKGTDNRQYPWGNTPANCNKANFVNCGGLTQPVGSYPAGQSPYGMQDLAGNVWEWCRDWYGTDYYSEPGNSVNPEGPTEGTERIIRGGSWGMGAKALRCANRNAQIPTYSSNSLGFRVSKQ